MKLLISKTAKRDLIDIWQFIAQENPIAASKVLESLDSRSHELLKNPMLGPARPDIRKNLRHLVDGKYLILYRINEDTIEIARYLHGASDLKSL